MLRHKEKAKDACRGPGMWRGSFCSNLTYSSSPKALCPAIFDLFSQRK